MEDSKIKFDAELLRKSLGQKRKSKRNKRLLIFFSVLSILLLGLTFFANQETERATKNEKIAIEAKEDADKSAFAAKISENSAQTAKIKAQKAEQKATRLKNISDAIKLAFEAEKNLDLNKIDSAIVQSKKAHNLFINNGNLERENQIYSALNRSLFEGKSKKGNFYNNINSIGFSTISQSNSSKEFMTLDNSKKVSFYISDDTCLLYTSPSPRDS